MVNIEPIPAFSDNYIWLLFDADTREAAVVDPGDAAPVIETLQARELKLSTVLITHHHFDHVGGLPGLIDAYSPLVYGPRNPAIEGIDRRLAAEDTLEVLGIDFEVLEVPGHTLDHIAYYHGGKDPMVFCGDTLFAGGCGRLFEGNPPMMLRSLDALASLPPQTRVYCAHEYTVANLNFARTAEPANEALQKRLADAEATRQRGAPTVPSELSLELATNPFLRSGEPQLKENLRREGRLRGESPEDVFAAVRSWKDSF